MTNQPRKIKGQRRQACDSCRRKKAKCEWTDGNSCTLCTRNKTECNIQNVMQERNASLEWLERMPISSKQADQMVKLLKKISNKLSANVNDPELLRALGEGECDPAKSLPSKHDATSSSSENWDSIQKRMQGLFQVLRHEEGVFLDPMPKPQIVDNGKRNTSVGPAMEVFNNHYSSTSENPGSPIPVALESLDEYFLPSSHKLSPLPARDEAILLVNEYFETFNQAIPLYDKASFLRLVLQHDLNHGNKQEGSGWWASLNIVLALAHRMRAMLLNSPRQEDTKSWGYLRNALEVLPELTLHNRDLLSIQALLGIVMFLQGTAMPYPAYSLTAAAIRQLHSLGLHKQNTGGDTQDLQQQRRVFWVAYCLDKDISLRTNQPFVQNEYDMDVDFPDAGDDHLGLIWLKDGSDSINIFRLRLQLSTVQARIYHELYSVPAGKVTHAERIWRIQDLHAETEQWRALISTEFQPENIFASLNTSSMIHMTTLYISYFNCVMKIHTKAMENEDLVISASNDVAIQEAIKWSKEACILASRSILQLLHYLPHGEYACIWSNIFSFSEAFFVLVANISLDPFGEVSLPDLNICQSTQQVLEKLASNEQNPCVIPLYKRCTELLETAKEGLRNSGFGV